MKSLSRNVNIPAGTVSLPGVLDIPEGASGIVLFAHGSGSSRFSPRNNFVAEVLRKRGLGTLLMDLMTQEEDQDYRRRFDIDLLVTRLLAATLWLQEHDETRNLKIGYFGGSTGAAAAVESAAKLENQVSAVVSRGGRVDLALPYLDQLKAPTLLIVGGLDNGVIEINQQAFDKIKAVKKLEIVSGASHLFEEPGTLETVATLSANWFVKYLR
ncbi:MAG: dienelactone hydrolase family protein [Erysipelotrichaceae bacterium]|nr:dienelactone hydrolase family protein [Erysipelotrichaceae bacterium]